MVQIVVIGEDPGAEADAAKGRELYLVTFAHPKTSHSSCGKALLHPESLSRQEMLDKFCVSCEKPAYADARSIQAARPVPLKNVAVFREFHKENDAGVAHAHYHIAVVVQRAFMFLPVKRALLNLGLASHWSTSHDGYWSIIRYLWWPSPPKKPDGTKDKQALTWSAPGFSHPDFAECCTVSLSQK